MRLTKQKEPYPGYTRYMRLLAKYKSRKSEQMSTETRQDAAYTLDSTPTRKPKRFEPFIAAQPSLFDVGADWLPGQTELFPEEAQPGDVSLDELREKPKGFTIEVCGLAYWFSYELEFLPADCFLIRSEHEKEHLVIGPHGYAAKGPFYYATIRTLRHGESDTWELLEVLGLGHFKVRFRNVDRLPLSHLAEGTRFRTEGETGVLTVGEWRNDWKIGARTTDGRCVKLDVKTICTPA